MKRAGLIGSVMCGRGGPRVDSGRVMDRSWSLRVVWWERMPLLYPVFRE